MNQSFSIPRRKKLAIIGAGISGLSAAYSLADDMEITVFEKEPRLGGHARTVVAGRNGTQPVDTGFIVFNYANYPHLTRMFRDLDVPVETSNMSFGATIDNGRVEYALRDLNSIFAQRKQLLNPQMYRMVRDILRFGKRAEATAQSEDMTTGELLDALGLGDWFINYYLLPICGAIWSTPPSEIRDFPAKALVQFFRNHALLEAGAQHQWWTVSGGSIEYVTRLQRHLQSKGVTFFTGQPVKAVKRSHNNVELHFDGEAPMSFDEVILACHSDEALGLLDAPSPLETKYLSQIRYQDNHAILHADENQMPKLKSCWSSWVYQSDGKGEDAKIGVTYWMNRLQNLPETDPLFVTLNPASEIDQSKIYDENTFRHPIFDKEALAAQKGLAAVQGENRTWFAGAYLRHGFHEDGFASAVRVADALKAQLLNRVTQT